MKSSQQTIGGFGIHLQRKGKKHASYNNVCTFVNRSFFLNWWKKSEQECLWRLNSRHPHSKGMVEYYYCKNRREDECPALLRVIVDAVSDAVSVAKAEGCAHNHEVDVSFLIKIIFKLKIFIFKAKTSMEHKVINMEPFPLQTAKVVNIAVANR
jgi:hypothetical protein